MCARRAVHGRDLPTTHPPNATTSHRDSALTATTSRHCSDPIGPCSNSTTQGGKRAGPLSAYLPASPRRYCGNIPRYCNQRSQPLQQCLQTRSNATRHGHSPRRQWRGWSRRHRPLGGKRAGPNSAYLPASHRDSTVTAQNTAAAAPQPAPGGSQHDPSARLLPAMAGPAQKKTAHPRSRQPPPRSDGALHGAQGFATNEAMRSLVFQKRSNISRRRGRVLMYHMKRLCPEPNPQTMP